MRRDDPHRMRWREGLSTIAYLHRHPGDTAAITRVVEALQGKSLLRLLDRLRTSEQGRRLLSARPSLRAHLRDWAWLESHPPGSLGRAYLALREEHGLDPQGMTPYVDAGTTPGRAAQLDADEAFIQDYQFHSHDIYHVVTGYDLDLVGEIGLLAFTAAQMRNTGVVAMALLGFYSIRLPRFEGQRVAIAAARRGLRAGWLVEQNWVELFPRPLDEVQRELGLFPPPDYPHLYVGPLRERREARTRSLHPSATAGR